MHSAIALAAALACALLSNVAFRARNIAGTSDKFKLPFTPAPAAFSMWFVIYASLGIYVAARLVRDEDALHVSNALTAAALLCTAGWLPAFTSTANMGVDVAAALLLASTFLSVAAVHALPGKELRDAWMVGTAHVPLSLFAGWLTLACALSVGFSLERRNVRVPPATVIGVAGLVGACTVAFKLPMYALPAVWGLAFAPVTASNLSAIAVLLGASTAAAARVVFAV